MTYVDRSTASARRTATALERQPHAEGGAGGSRALHFDRAAMRLDRAPHERQPRTPAGACAGRVFRAPEASAKIAACGSPRMGSPSLGASMTACPLMHGKRHGAARP